MRNFNFSWILSAAPSDLEGRGEAVTIVALFCSLKQMCLLGLSAEL